MSCEDMNDRLHEYIDGELSQFERAQVETHLRRCASCAEELRLLRQTVALLADLDEMDVPASFRPQLMARVAALPVPAPAPVPLSAARRARATPLWQRWGLTSAAAAAVIALVAINFIDPMVNRPPDSPEGSVVARSVDPTPAETFTPSDATGRVDTTVGPVTTPTDPQPPGNDNPSSGVKPPAEDQPTGDGSPKPAETSGVTSTDVGANPEPTDSTPPEQVITDPGVEGASLGPAPAPLDVTAERGMAHYTINVTVRASDVAQAADKVHALTGNIDGRLVYEEYLPNGSLRFTFEVRAGSERPLLDGVADLGRLMEQRTDVTPLQTEYDRLLAIQKANQDTLLQLQAKAEDPTQPTSIRQAARDDIVTWTRYLAGIRQKISELQSQGEYTTIDLTLEAQRQ